MLIIRYGNDYQEVETMKHIYACITVMCIFVMLMLCGCQHSKPQVNVKTQTPAPKLLFPESELPGKYYFGDGLGVNCVLELKADKRFNFTWTGCMGVYDKNKGIWDLNGDLLTVRPDKLNATGGFRGMNIRYIPVKWGTRHFLIDENEMPGFCVMLSKLDPHLMKQLKTDEYYRHGLDYIKIQKPENISISGKPLIPARYIDFYENGPIVVKVVKVSDVRHAVINKGSADKVKPGMLLSLVNFGGLDIEVVSVDKHESVVKPIFYFNSNVFIKVGHRFTTGDTWDRPRGTGFQRYTKPPELPRPATPKGGKSGMR